MLGNVHFWRGRWQEAIENHEEAARLEPPGFLAGANWGGLFLTRAYVGDSDSALAMLEESRGNLPRPGQANRWGAWVMLVAVVEGLAVLGERDEAAQLYPLTLDAIATGVLAPWGGLRLLETTAGIAAACGGQWEKAEEHFQTALRQAHELPHKIEQPEVRRWYARMLIDRAQPGDRDKARELLTEAVAMYRQMGMPKHVEMAERMLREV
jgi:tetratricopeptide (TPR) repeat protein